MHALSIRVLGLSTRAHNALLFNRIESLGDLNGIPIEQFRRLRQVGSTAATEILDAVSGVVLDAGQTEPTSSAATGGTETVSNQAQAEANLSIPAELSNWPMEALRLSADVEHVLRMVGAMTLGDLGRLPLAGLEGHAQIGERGVGELRAAITSLLLHPTVQRLGKLRDGADPVLRRFRNRIIPKLLGAQSAEQEIQALLEGLSPRDSQMIRARWSGVNGRRQPLEAIGESHGMTRERVRQIVRRHDDRLGKSGLCLPHCSAIISLLDGAGGVLPERELLELLRDRKLEASRRTLGVIQSLSEIGLTDGPLRFVAEYRLWLSKRGITEWLETGRLAEEARRVRAELNPYLERIGAVPVQALSDLAPLDPSHALSMLTRARRGRGLVRVGDYLVPRGGRGSVLQRAVLEMLAVTPDLTTAEILAGLQQRAAFREVPAEVILGVLRHNGSFRLEGDRIIPLSEDELTRFPDAPTLVLAASHGEVGEGQGGRAGRRLPWLAFG